MNTDNLSDKHIAQAVRQMHSKEWVNKEHRTMLDWIMLTAAEIDDNEATPPGEAVSGEVDWPFTYIVPTSKHEYVPKHHAEEKIRRAVGNYTIQTRLGPMQCSLAVSSVFDELVEHVTYLEAEALAKRGEPAVEVTDAMVALMAWQRWDYEVQSAKVNGESVYSFAELTAMRDTARTLTEAALTASHSSIHNVNDSNGR